MGDEVIGFEVNLVWSVPKESGFDAVEFAHGVLENGKENLKKDGYLTAAAFVITADEVKAFAIGFNGIDNKFQAYSKLVSIARESRAETIVTLNDCYWTERTDESTYYQGKLAKEGAKEEVSVTITSPTAKTRVLNAKYERIGGKFVFAPPRNRKTTK